MNTACYCKWETSSNILCNTSEEESLHEAVVFNMWCEALSLPVFAIHAANDTTER